MRRRGRAHAAACDRGHRRIVALFLKTLRIVRRLSPAAVARRRVPPVLQLQRVPHARMQTMWQVRLDLSRIPKAFTSRQTLAPRMEQCAVVDGTH
jgi:hypothetical protein